MEASRFLPQAEPEPPQIRVWAVYESDELLHHLSIDGTDTGEIDLEFSDGGRRIYTSGLDAEKELEEGRLKGLAWPLIAASVREIYPQAEVFESLDGQAFH